MGKSFLVQCRGLPWECTDNQLKEFFDNSGIEYVDIPKRGGRATGEGIVSFDNEGDYRNALKKNKQMIGTRYIEVFPMNGAPPSKRREDGPGHRRERDELRYSREYRDKAAPYSRRQRNFYGGERNGGGPRRFSSDGIIRLRGLPFSVSIRDIIQFFSPLPIVRDGVLLPDQRRSKFPGEAMVVFENTESAELAKNRHMKNIGHRYIEVFEATYSELIRFADENDLRVPNAGGLPSARSYSSGPPSSNPYNGPQDYRPSIDDYHSGNSGYPPSSRGPPPSSRGLPPSQQLDSHDSYGRSRDNLPHNGPAFPGNGSYDYCDRSSPNAQQPYGPPAQGGGYYDSPFGPSKTSFDTFPRQERGSDFRNGPDAFTAESRYSDYGNGQNRGGYDSRGSCPPTNWRGLSSSGNGPVESYSGGGNDSWGNAPPQPLQHSGSSRIDSFGYPPSGESFGQREGGPMRRSDYGRPDTRFAKPDPYGYRDNREYQGTQHFVLRMRGVPFRATEADVFDFFLPIRPNHIELLKDHNGRPSGDARVIFLNRKDYDEALVKDRQYLGDRYIEMIPDNGRY